MILLFYCCFGTSVLVLCSVSKHFYNNFPLESYHYRAPLILFEWSVSLYCQIIEERILENLDGFISWGCNPYVCEYRPSSTSLSVITLLVKRLKLFHCDQLPTICVRIFFPFMYICVDRLYPYCKTYRAPSIRVGLLIDCHFILTKLTF